MKDTIKVNVQTNSMIAIQQGDSTVKIHPLKMSGYIQDLGLTKRKATQLKPEKIWIDELAYQPEELYTESLMEVLSKSIAEEINTTSKKKKNACYDPAVQVHSLFFFSLSL